MVGLFNAFDIDGSAGIDVYEWCRAVSVLTRGTRAQILDFVFDVYDLDWYVVLRSQRQRTRELTHHAVAAKLRWTRLCYSPRPAPKMMITFPQPISRGSYSAYLTPMVTTKWIARSLPTPFRRITYCAALHPCSLRRHTSNLLFVPAGMIVL